MILFDGQCRLCLGFVAIVTGRDSSDLFRFAPLQAKLGQDVRESHGVPKDIDSVVLLRDKELFTHSDAALEVLGD
ncbi:thiol-disulfide oxidoreductase DCC family protein, partial [Herbidospora sp. RD11066]